MQADDKPGSGGFHSVPGMQIALPTKSAMEREEFQTQGV